MRFPHRPAALIAAFGVTLAALAFSLSFASASLPAATGQATFHQVVPGLAGDSAAGFAQPGATNTPTPASGSCTSGHSLLRTFGDAGAAAVNRDGQAVNTAFFNDLTRPASIPTDATRTAPLETSLYTVNANLVSMMAGPNGGIDVVIDNGGNSMRASFPASGCIKGLSAEDQGAINSARGALRIACGEPPASGSRALRGTVTLTGPGYWGTKSQEGASRSGAEIGPVFAFQFTDSGPCDPKLLENTTPTPTPTTQGTNVSTSWTRGNPGMPVTVTTKVSPAHAGAQCYIHTPKDASLDHFPMKLTDANGEATWEFTLPTYVPAPSEFNIDAYCDTHFASVVLRVFPPGQ